MKSQMWDIGISGVVVHGSGHVEGLFSSWKVEAASYEDAQAELEKKKKEVAISTNAAGPSELRISGQTLARC